MMPGPDLVFRCPDCGDHCSKRSLLSGNTFCSTLYSDGFRQSPMLPLLPNLVACPHCGSLWLSESRRPVAVSRWARQRDRDDEDGLPDWHDLPPDGRDRRLEPIREPTENQFYQALERGLAKSLEDEADLRLRAWWRSNDTFRRIGGPRPPHPCDRPVAWRANLLALRPLVEVAMPGYPLLAEIHRELGLMPEAFAALEGEWHPVARPFVACLRKLCESGETRVVAFIEEP